MLYDVRISDVSSYKDAVIRKVREKKQADPTFTVVDVGGSVNGWSASIVDAIVDINPAESGSPIRFFKVNINDETSWHSVLEYVRDHGKFSYAICSHTIEDVCNPGLTLRMLPQIANSGTIAVPSKYREFSRIEGPYLGYIHHRWVYDVRNGNLIGYPKLGFLEFYPKLHALGRKEAAHEQLAFHWAGSIPHSFVNGDYLGPNINSVIEYYLALLD
jgi:hypothetical protein